MVCAKLRIRFRKSGDLRFISHHDLLRFFERALRRAGIPFHSTAGFNPKPRLVFAMPLSLGIVGAEEVAELELDAELSPEEVCQRLARQMPAGLEILNAERIERNTTAHVRSVCYRIRVPVERLPGLAERVLALKSSASCWIERRRPRPRRIDLRQYVEDVHLLPEALEMNLRVTPNGTARPEEVLALLGLQDLLDAGAVLERVRMDLEDQSAGAVSACAAPEDKGAGAT